MYFSFPSYIRFLSLYRRTPSICERKKTRLELGCAKMEQTCQQCKNSYCSEESVVVCEGFCEGIRRFHATCVGLSKEEADVCLFRNILWMCDDCRDLMENVHFRSYIKSTKPLETPIESIKLEVAKVNAMLNRLNETIDSLRNAPISALNASSPSPPEDV